MRFNRGLTIALLACGAALASLPARAVDGQTMVITGEDYTKWLWGNQPTDGSVYNFTTVPGEGYGDNGQGTEIEWRPISHASVELHPAHCRSS